MGPSVFAYVGKAWDFEDAHTGSNVKNLYYQLQTFENNVSKKFD